MDSKFTYGPGDAVFPQCWMCRHAEGAKCSAFPHGIPRDIRDNAVDHRLPIPGDNGIRFEPKPGSNPAVLDSLYRELDSLV